MKSTTSFPLIASLVLFSITRMPAVACGPYSPIIPTPEFFALSEPHKPMSYYERDENLKLWQALTSRQIPLADIEEAVYEDSWSRYSELTGYAPQRTDNLFYTYLNNSDDRELSNFLEMAKLLEEHWSNTRSPWYYPQDRSSDGGIEDFHRFANQFRDYKGKRLRDRYALQVSRALFASREYSACIEHFDTAFADIPESNLMKRMAQRYVAGCWSRLGEKQRGDSIFALAGDVWSITANEPAEYMARHNPNAPQLMEYIRSRASDSAFMVKMNHIARQLLRKRQVRHRGDWHFLSAYVCNEFNYNASLAREQIRCAANQSFSTNELKDLAHAYKMKLDAQSGNRKTLLRDLEWMESMTDPCRPEAGEWIRRCRNIIYADWIPRLWTKQDYSTAILLCAYADNLMTGNQRTIIWERGAWMDETWTSYYIPPVRSISTDEMRDNEEQHNELDYSCLSFQMAGSLTSGQLAAAYRRIISDEPLYNFLRRKARTDRDYYYELIGTLALREENFARAEHYLSRVSEHYLKTMNICKAGYLAKDPFRPYPSRWKEVSSSYSDETWAVEHEASRHISRSNCLAKLEFARKMQTYKKAGKHGKTADERGMAHLMYAIGRRNSLEECWALTQYWRGDGTGIFEPDLQYWNDDFAENHYGFLYDYVHTIGYKCTEARYEHEIKAAMSMLASDEAKAKAEYMLGNVATVIKHYGNTSTAQHVRASCDNWKSWL